MPRLVLVRLVVLAAAALVLSLAGVLRPPFAALLATLVAAVGASSLGDRVMAALARARPTGESPAFLASARSVLAAVSVRRVRADAFAGSCARGGAAPESLRSVL